MSVFERENADGIARGEKALLAVPDIVGQPASRSTDARIEEAKGLAEAISIDVIEARAYRIRSVRPASLFGMGQAAEMGEIAKEAGAGLLLVDAALSPVQQKNLEDATQCKVIDRTGLILEIFGERAATAEGRLQVELAHLDYQAGRLVRSWTHLERQRGGFGFLGGPGETQIEADRRMIRDRMAKIRRELEQVKKTRGLHRDRRQRAPWPVVALVGYTNAGKSTLFNRLTRADVMAEDLLFATLDPTMREIRVPGHDKVILSDTVGFVSDLPTQLVAAFRATLEEVASADLILHVRDIAHPDTQAQADDVATVLKELGLEGEGAPPQLEVWNKIDLLEGDRGDDILGEAKRRDDVMAISAVSGEGVDNLLEHVGKALSLGAKTYEITLPAGDGARLSWLHQYGKVLDSRLDGETLHLDVQLDPANKARFDSL
ncbi:GTPase HflX [Sphingomicrobium marinum]|uniref:GTPase HflX n=1 Tax=Sphingomicrobium marinum TaxID=1227950 RepID=UPI00223F264A|nr:GTPase HflX [Sphingomicrobium marinum]